MVFLVELLAKNFCCDFCEVMNPLCEFLRVRDWLCPPLPYLTYSAWQVAVNGQPFDWQGIFKFALVNADGNASLV